MDLGAGIRKALAKLTGAGFVDEKAVKELAKELQRVLISNDVNVRLVFDLTKRIEEKAVKEKPLPGISLREHVVRVVYDELRALLGEKFEPRLDAHRVLLCGLFGSGKSTSVAKLARFYQSKGLKVAVIAGDVWRPAAHEQLEQLSKLVHCGFYGRKGAKAEEIAREALAQLKGYDILIFDSAGRSAFDPELVDELKHVNRVFKPDEKYLVVSADVGQVAGRQAAQFHGAIGLTGVIVTKMDGSGKGGGALSSVAASGSKVAFIGTGEKPADFEVFDATKFVSRLVGFPDLASLLDKMKELGKEQNLEKSLEEGKLDYDGFLAQMRAMRKMGPLKNVMQMLGAYDIPEEMLGKGEAKFKQFEAAVQSMTKRERENPELMKNRARQERVANGAGLKLDEVRELVSNFERVQKMMKGMRRNRGLLKQLGKMGGGLKGMPGLGG